ncbi:MAG: hypothetical protein H0X72_07785 [Acidobacteria bacterium]|jgi:hypothetical protein|nr:hypothetical protein [Acidobacteriota bacterium]
MQTYEPPSDIDVEKFFNEFVEDFGGELISKIFNDIFVGESKRPDNADYFLFNRSVIAELKYLEKN